MDGGAKSRVGTGENRDHWWHREGAEFDSLTLTPSIHAQDKQPDGSKTTHWHGFITNGGIA